MVGATAGNSGGVGGGQGVFTGSGGATTTIADTNGTNGAFVSLTEPVINDGGTVAFQGILSTFQLGIATGTGGPTTIVVDGKDGIAPVTSVSINASGTLAFPGVITSTGVRGIFTNGGLPDPVIKEGDSLFGSTVRLLDVVPQINDSGQIGFSYTLLDGRTGIARADPVPEPTSLAFIVSGVLLVALKQRRGRRRSRGSHH